MGGGGVGRGLAHNTHNCKGSYVTTYERPPSCPLHSNLEFQSIFIPGFFFDAAFWAEIV